jgi:hypothetical protein
MAFDKKTLRRQFNAEIKEVIERYAIKLNMEPWVLARQMAESFLDDEIS